MDQQFPSFTSISMDDSPALALPFEYNAAVLVTPEGEIKGTDIKGPVAAEAAEKWPRIANLASLIV